jgi:hypothetical protein
MIGPKSVLHGVRTDTHLVRTRAAHGTDVRSPITFRTVQSSTTPDGFLSFRLRLGASAPVWPWWVGGRAELTMQSSSNLPVFGYRDGYVSIVEHTLTLPGHVMVVVTMLIERAQLARSHTQGSLAHRPPAPRFQPSLHHINTFTATIAPVSWSSPRSLQHSHARPPQSG